MVCEQWATFCHVPARREVERRDFQQAICGFRTKAMWADISLPTLALVWIGSLLGGMAAGAAGFAFGVVATSIWLHAISPIHAAFLVMSNGLINQIGLNWKLRHAMNWRRLTPFLLGGIVGIPIGVALVVKSNPGAIRSALAVLMVAYGVFALVAPPLRNLRWGGQVADMTVGFAGGVLGGLAGLSGILPAIWTQLRGWPKDAARGVYQPFILVAHLLSLIVLGAVALDRTGVMLFIAALPATLCGIWIGWMIYGRLDERLFRRLFAGLLVVSGALLIY
jgi:hypothetical protein